MRSPYTLINAVDESSAHCVLCGFFPDLLLMFLQALLFVSQSNVISGSQRLDDMCIVPASFLWLLLHFPGDVFYLVYIAFRLYAGLTQRILGLRDGGMLIPRAKARGSLSRRQDSGRIWFALDTDYPTFFQLERAVLYGYHTALTFLGHQVLEATLSRSPNL